MWVEKSSVITCAVHLRRFCLAVKFWLLNVQSWLYVRSARAPWGVPEDKVTYVNWCVILMLVLEKKGRYVINKERSQDFHTVSLKRQIVSRFSWGAVTVLDHIVLPSAHQAAWPRLHTPPQLWRPLPDTHPPPHPALVWNTLQSAGDLFKNYLLRMR